MHAVAAELQARLNARWKARVGELSPIEGFQVDYLGGTDEHAVFAATLFGGAEFVGTKQEVEAVCRLHVKRRRAGTSHG